MNKSDLNSSMLFKIRDEGLCVLLNRNGDNFQVFYNKNNIVKGHAWGISSLNDDKASNEMDECFYEIF